MKTILGTRKITTGGFLLCRCAKESVCIVLFCLFFLPQFLSGQDWASHFDLLNTEKGLSGDVLTALCQDRRGFLWIGTNGQGLNRYDGNEVKVWRHSNRDSFSICSDLVWSILEDETGKIWVSTQSGISRLNPYNGRFEHFLTEAGSNVATYVFKDVNGCIWAVSSIGVSRFNREEDKFERCLAPEEFCIFQHSGADKDGRLWLGGSRGITAFDPRSGKTQHFYPFPNIPSNEERNRTSVKTDHYGNIWVFSWGGGLLRFHPESSTFEQFLWNKNPKFPNMANIAFDIQETFNSEGKRIFWICTEQGAFRFELKSLSFPSLDQPHRVLKPGTDIAPVGWDPQHIISDQNGNLWFGSNYGLYRYKKEQEYIHFMQTPGEATIGQVFFTKNGEALVSSQLNSPLMILDAGHHWKKVFKSLPPNSKEGTGKMCWASAKDEEDGIIYAATFHGLVAYNEKNGKTHWYKWQLKDSTGIIGPKINQVLPIGNGLLLLGYWRNGLQLFDTRRNKGVWHFEDNGKIVWCLKRINGVVWVGTEHALYTFDPKTRTMVVMTPLNYNHVKYQDVIQDHKGRTWVGTNTGLFQLDVQNHLIIENYTMENGLAGMDVSSIEEDSLGRLWLGTSGGICVFNPTTKKFYRPDKKILNSGNIVRAPTGEFWLTSGNQIKIFKPELFHDPRPSKVYITGLKINEKDTVLNIPFEQTSQILLSPGQNALTFSFTAIDLDDWGKTNFQYKLEGLQSGWVPAGKTRRAAFVNLHPGEYTFRVRPEDAGEDSFYDATLKVVVTDFFWQRLWFKIAVITLVVGLLISMAFLIYTRQLRSRNLQLQSNLAIQEERNRISRDLHDDLGSGLGAISLLSNIALSKTDSTELRTEVHKIAESARELSEKVHEIIWAANPKNDTLERFIGYLHQYAASLFGDSYYDLRARIPQAIPAATIAGVHRRALFLVYKEALNNIIHHALASRVEIDFHSTLTSVEICIRDNGKGFDPAAKIESGNGLTNMRKRISDIGGEFQLESNKSGTRILFKIEL